MTCFIYTRDWIKAVMAWLANNGRSTFCYTNLPEDLQDYPKFRQAASRGYIKKVARVSKANHTGIWEIVRYKGKI